MGGASCDARPQGLNSGGGGASCDARPQGLNSEGWVGLAVMQGLKD